MRTLTLAFAVIGLLSAAPVHAQKDPEEPRTATPTKGLLWGSKMTVENEPCCTLRQTETAGDRTEASLLASVPDRALRDGPILKLKLQNNRILKITDCSDQDACEADRFRSHRLAAWWPKLRYYVVHVGLHEDSLAYLISEQDGRTTRVAAVPVLSPSGRNAVAVLSNLMSGVDLNVIDMTANPPKVVDVSTMPACAGTSQDAFLRPRPVWIDDSHVRFEGVSPQPGDNPNAKQLLKISAGTAEWKC